MSNSVDSRFLDLLDEPGEKNDNQVDPYMTLANKYSISKPLAPEEWSQGPLKWSVQCSVELQQIVDSFNMREINDLRFSVTVADPNQADCPLVACSSGFADLTGYQLPEIVGRNCRFLLNGVPRTYINEQTRFHARDFCIAVSKGIEYDSCSAVLPPGIKPCGVGLPKGEIICVQTNARKSGELFRNMFFMKQVWLDDAPFILGLQAGIPEEYEEGSELQELQSKCQDAWSRLDIHMTTIEQVLAKEFWYSACMRRQE